MIRPAAYTFICVFSIMLLYACGSNDTINNADKRNGNWCWYVTKGKAGKWLLIKDLGDTPDGAYTYFYDNGTISQTASYINKKAQDTTFTYDPSGRLIIYSTYKDDKKRSYYYHDGAFKDYNSNCTVYLTGTVKNHARTGLWTWYYDDGHADFTEDYHDSLTKTRISYYDSGLKADSGNFYNHQKVGIHKFWYASGKRKSETLYVDGVQKEFKEWDESGKEKAGVN